MTAEELKKARRSTYIDYTNRVRCFYRDYDKQVNVARIIIAFSHLTELVTINCEHNDGVLLNKRDIRKALDSLTDTLNIYSEYIEGSLWPDMMDIIITLDELLLLKGDK